MLQYTNNLDEMEFLFMQNELMSPEQKRPRLKSSHSDSHEAPCIMDTHTPDYSVREGWSAGVNVMTLLLSIQSDVEWIKRHIPQIEEEHIWLQSLLVPPITPDSP